MGFLEKLFGNKNQRELKKIQPTVARIAQLEATMQAKSEAELKAMTPALKQRIDKGESLDSILPEAYAVVREAGKRALGMRHYDVQMIGGIVLHQGRIAEMRTGEGKTLVATLPTYLNALAGKGVHVVTVNDYLARRDAEWMGRLHGYLGLSTGVVVHGLEDFERQRAYMCDITYGQNNEFGFDYLRDNMKSSPDRMVQRGLFYAVVDEVDSILIDEARTPLIISGQGEASGDLYGRIDKLIPRLQRDVDYTVDEKGHSATLTDEGVEKMESLLGVENLYAAGNIQLVHHVNQGLKAHTLYKRNVNYLVEEGKVVIIDEHTGRKMPGRRWSDGLHQAIEAKEGVTIEEENQTMATVTFQNYFRMYKKLSGMTGTADTEATEFHQIYKLDVTVIPTNKPIARKDQPDLVYKNEAGKFRAVVADIEECHLRGQPVLVGTVSVEKSEVVANLLRAKNIPFHVLNAKQHQREAGIVAQAGRKGAITIATNMAGRGTDILLGGNPEALAREAVNEEKALLQAEASTDEQGEPYRGTSVPDFDEDARYEALLAELKPRCAAEREEVLAAGGLKIIGTERHESRRIDNQLRGRAGRQGDPGASRFYLSLQDDLLRIFGLDRMTGIMERLGLEEDVPIESGMVTNSIQNAQKKVEGQHFDTRKNVLEYDDVMNQQRKTIYALRRQILEGRYHPEPTEAQAKDGIETPTPTQSGELTIPMLMEEVRGPVNDLLTAVDAQVKARDEDLAMGKPVADDREAWRIARSEVWRQFGAFLDLEKLYAGPREALVAYCVKAVASSQVQQRERMYDLFEHRVSDLVSTAFGGQRAGASDDIDFDALEEALEEQFGVPFELDNGNMDEVATQAWGIVEKMLRDREQTLTRAWFLYFGRHFALEEIDQQWVEHLKTMEALREGIGLQGYGQKDPKKEYKKAGFDLFGEMMLRIQSSTVTKVSRVQLRREEEQIPLLQARHRPVIEAGASNKFEEGDEAAQAAAQAAARKPMRAAQLNNDAKVEPVRRDKPKVGRNDPCPCGSGKKYKKCHGKDEADGAEADAPAEQA